MVKIMIFMVLRDYKIFLGEMGQLKFLIGKIADENHCGSKTIRTSVCSGSKKLGN
jgi:hypothetical protein